MTTDNIEKIEDLLEDIPEEIRDFIVEGELDSALEEVSKNLSKPLEIIKLKNAIIFYILGISEAGELKSIIDSLLIPPNEKVKIAQLIQEKIIDEIILLIEVHKEIDADSTDSKTTIPQSLINPQTQNPLTSLQSRLTQSNMILPVKRDVSLDSTPAKPAIDPYREIPEK